jgi:DNA-binding transcriptional MerR regulator
MQIGEAARRAGVTAPTIRYYEEIGLLPKALRSSAGYRSYTDGTVEELRFIRKAQALGFSLDEIRGILRLSRSGRRPCAEVLALARQHLAALDERLRRLQAFRAQLAAGVAQWDAEETAITCTGLCRWIADAEIETELPRETSAPRPRSA